MATKKKVAKPAVKPAPKKAVAPVKKAAPAKKAAPQKVAAKKPVAKPSKPVAKKVVPAKKVVTPVKKAIQPALKPVTKKVAAPVKKTAPVPAKAAPQKSVAKAVPAKPIIKPATKPVTKKEEVKKQPVAAKPVVAKETPAKAVVTKEVKPKDIKVTPPKPVVIPKINTKTVRKYQPDFTKSVLDKAAPDPGAPSQRYSDVELAEFKELIQRKLEAAKKELSYLHGLITRKDEMGSDETDNRYMTMEDGSLSMEREQLSQMASRQITFIDHLEKALMRIENKTYGICRVTGRLIDKARLRAVPHATLSIEAKMSGGK
ncbi:MAG: TraR/DksA C4-type zinc finger protein [Sphingobacteriales bacterium]|nr:TraR/DksA C4-type zinc finger protein [Sphingobacteriales bacterium]